MIEKARATARTNALTSGGETADHFLTVRNLQAAMGDSIRDSQNSIIGDNENRLQTAVMEDMIPLP
eukprot:CAMPEP_0170459200 /NCGR_PEP_ID=MMETSP0123-20130129/5974_1 /TAXON_ID=182087 /ORGANISM="Favella ehrenbergii, Strain Fehren 1" /LENGTH=65 /DNA_ID=CAMNT_0010723719 /DNA_START=463 /DNA_END=660 /DNA_ORIENTATION=-